MGQLQSKAAYLKATTAFLNASERDVNKLWECFNDVAEGFGLNQDELVEICRSMQQTLEIHARSEMDQLSGALFTALDTDENGLVDALEFLGTMAMMSAMPIPQKLTCKSQEGDIVYNCYDFNETGQLSLDELTLAFKSTLTGLCKLCVGVSCPTELVLEDLVHHAFQKAQKPGMDDFLSLPEFLRFAETTPELTSWVDYFDCPEEFVDEQDGDDSDAEREAAAGLLAPSALDDEATARKRDASLPHDAAAPDFTKDKMLSRRPWQLAIANATPSTPPTIDARMPAASLELEWIYGYNSDLRNVVHYISPAEAVYPAGGVIVVYDTVAHRQRFACHHAGLVQALAVHPTDHRVIASGEAALLPKIVIWSTQTLSESGAGGGGGVLSVLRGFHRRGVSHLAWMSNGRTLVTVGQDEFRCVAVYQWEKATAPGHAGREPALLAVKCCYSKDATVCVRVWSRRLEPGAQFDLVALGSSAPRVRSLVASPDGGAKLLIATASAEIFEIASSDGANLHFGPVVCGHSAFQLHGLAVHPLRRECCSVGDDRTVRVWDLSAHRQLRIAALDAPARACTYSPDGSSIAVGQGAEEEDEETPAVTITDPDLLEWRRRQQPKLVNLNKQGDGLTLAVGSSDNCIYSYHTEDWASKGVEIARVATLKDVEWLSSSCPYSWGAQAHEIWAVDRSPGAETPMLVTGDALGSLRLFRYPCVNPESLCQWRVEREEVDVDGGLNNSGDADDAPANSDDEREVSHGNERSAVDEAVAVGDFALEILAERLQDPTIDPEDEQGERGEEPAKSSSSPATVSAPSVPPSEAPDEGDLELSTVPSDSLELEWVYGYRCHDQETAKGAVAAQPPDDSISPAEVPVTPVVIVTVGVKSASFWRLAAGRTLVKKDALLGRKGRQGGSPPSFLSVVCCGLKTPDGTPVTSLETHARGELHGLSVCYAKARGCTTGDDGLGSGGTGRRHKKDGSMLVFEDRGQSVELVYETRDTKQSVTVLRFSPDGQSLVCGALDGSVYIYDVPSNYTKRAVFSKHKAPVTHLDLASDSQYMRSNCRGFELFFADVTTGSHGAGAKTYYGHSGAVAQLGFSGAGGALCLSIGRSDRCILQWRRLYGAGSGGDAVVSGNASIAKDPEDDPDLDAEGRFLPEAFVNDGGGAQSEIKPYVSAILPPPGNSQEPSETDGIAGHRSFELEHVFGLRSHDVRQNVVYARPKRIVYPTGCVGVSYDRREHRQQFYTGHTRPILSSGEICAQSFAHERPRIHVWEPATCTRVIELSAFHSKAVTALSFSTPDGKLLAAMGQDEFHSLAVYRSASGRWFDGSLFASSRTTRRSVFFVCFIEDPQSAGGCRLVSGGDDHRAMAFLALELSDSQCCHLYAWEACTVARVIPAHTGSVYAIHATSLGCATGGRDGHVKLWARTTLTPLADFDVAGCQPAPQNAAVRSLCWDVAEDRLLLGTKGAELFELSRLTGESILVSESHYDRTVQLQGLAAHPLRPELVVTAGGDHTSAAYSPDGKWLAVGFGGSGATSKNSHKDGAFA
uniref:EF-hand domain-containing protein n=1 Tax=Phytophthora ramorum TaxID=164328 RepID=H3HDC2_PHYRM